MQELTQADKAKSIAKGEFIYPQKTFTRLEFFASVAYAILTPFLVSFFLLRSSTVMLSQNQLPLLLILSMASLFSFYIAYRKLTEKRLKQIRTASNPNRNKDLLMSYAESKGYSTFHESPDFLIFIVKRSVFMNKGTLVFVCLLENDNVYYTFFRYNSNPPILAHIYLEKHLKELLC